MVSQFNHLESAFVDRLELNAEEHGSDVREDERLELLDHDRLHVTHLVVSHQHVHLRTDVNELRANLVEHRHDVQTAVGALHAILSELRVIVDTACVSR